MVINPLAVTPATPAPADALQTKRRETALTEMEKLFARMLLHEMRSGMPEGGVFDDDFATRTMHDLLDDALAEAIGAGGQLGIARLVGDQLRAEETRQRLLTAAAAATSSSTATPLPITPVEAGGVLASAALPAAPEAAEALLY